MTSYELLTSPLPQWNLTNKTVFVRADLNVPRDHGTLLDTFRLERLRPTLDLILAKGGSIRLATHVGSPQGYNPEYNVAPLAQWLKSAGYDLPGRIELLDNLRFESCERPAQIACAVRWAEGVDLYIDDAFGSLHRHDASLTLMPELFDQHHRGIGLLVEEELRALAPLRKHAYTPMLLIMGGGKGIDKLKRLPSLCNVVDTILLCPGLSEVFQDPAIDDEPWKQELLAAQESGKLRLPLDYLAYHKKTQSLQIVAAEEALNQELLICAVGPTTLAAWQPHIAAARAIIFNGPMGFEEIPHSQEPLYKILTMITTSSAHTVLGGGDAHRSAQKFNLAQKFSYCSTGGGSLLAYVGNEPLPALDALG